MEIKMPSTDFSKSKVTYLSIIGMIMGAWAAESYAEGVMVNLDWPLTTIVCAMVVGRSVQVICDALKK